MQSNHPESRPARAALRGEAAALGLLAALTLLFFWPMLAGRVPCLRDSFIDCYPWRVFGREAFRAGHVPLWNPYSCCGKPFVANTQSAFFYPLHLIFYLLPLPWALSVSTVVHVFLAGAFTYALVRHLGSGRAGGVLAAIAFMFSPMLVSRIEFMALFDCLTWTPLAVLALDRAMEHPSPRRCAHLALVLAVQFLSGYPNELVLCGIALGLWWALRLAWLRWSADAPGRWSLGWVGATLPVAVLLALGLSTLQLLPTLELVPQSSRMQMGDERMGSSFSPPGLLLLVFPYLWGKPGWVSVYWGPSVHEFWLGTVYVGLGPLVLALAGRGGRFARKAAAAIAVLAVLLAMGPHAPLYSVLERWLPLFTLFRWPAKFLSIAVLFLAVLAGLGLDRLRRGEDAGRAALLAAALAAVAVVFVALLPRFPSLLVSTSGGPESPLAAADGAELARHVAEVWPASRAGAAGLVACAALFAGAWRGRVRGRALAALIIAGTFVDLYGASQPLMLYQDRALFGPGNRLLGESAREPGLPRMHCSFHVAQQLLYGCAGAQPYVWAHDGLVGDSNLGDHVFRDWGGDALRLRDYDDFHRYLDRGPQLPEKDLERFRDLAAIRYVVDSTFDVDAVDGALRCGALQVTRRDSALPRALIVGACAVEPNADRHIGVLANPRFDPRRMVLLDEPPEAPVAFDATGTVEGLAYDWNETSLTADCSGDAMLLLNDVYYEGWSATVDDQPVPIHRANHVFRAIRVPHGRHRVRFVYAPLSFQLGVGLSLVNAVLCALLLGLSDVPDWFRSRVR